MKFQNFKSVMPALAVMAATCVPALAQQVVDERTETIPVTITPISPGASGGTGMGGFITRNESAPGPNTVMQETHVKVLAFQIPDFNPDDLLTHVYHVGLFSETGNGSGTIYFDDTGYAEYELRTHAGQTPMQTFLYSVHVETREVRAFMDIDDVTLNKAALILTNLALKTRMRPGPGRVAYGGPLPGPRTRPVPPPPIGDEIRLSLSGDYLTLDDLQEQIFEQTRCNVEQEDGRYYLARCE